MQMRRIAAIVLAGCVHAAGADAGQRAAAAESRLVIRIAAADAAATGASLDAGGYDVLRVDGRTQAVDVAVTRSELQTLQRRGYQVTVLDRTRPLADALTLSTADPSPATTTRSASVGTLAAPASATLAAAATYEDYDALVSRMQDVAAAYPAIARLVDVTATYSAPATVEGRHLFALKISDNVDMDEDEPAMLIVAAHHAREIGTPLIALLAADNFTQGYGSDPRITAAVDGQEIWIAPVWNPDGYSYVFTGDNMWRKNRRVFTSGAGVDQNRNYPQGWSTSCAGSTSVASETYKGPSPASEAETQTMMAWSQAERFAKVIDYHSYGREVLYAYRCLGHPFSAWLQQEAAALSRASGYGGVTRAPSAEGEHPEWQFAKMGAYAFLIETHTEFQPPYDSAMREAVQVWPGILSVLERAIPVSGHVTDAETGAPLAARIDLPGVAFSQGETNASGGAFGAYHLFVPPGTYNVRFSAPGYTAITVPVTVTSTSAIVQDVALTVAPPAPPAPVEELLFMDDFEAARGWTVNPSGSDTATLGRWERGDPQATDSTGAKQLGTTVSGLNDLVTGRLAGTSSGAYDVDGGRTSIQSPAIAIPAAGAASLGFSYYFAHGTNASSADYFRVSVIGTSRIVVLEELGDGSDDDAAWDTRSVDLSPFAGQTVRILIETADAGTASLVEAAVDDVRVVVRK